MLIFLDLCDRLSHFSLLENEYRIISLIFDLEHFDLICVT
jgi:hypothetical protein